MPIDRGPGWEQDASGQWTFNPGTADLTTGAAPPGDFTGTVQSLDFGQELAGSTLQNTWLRYFDPYDTSKEERLGRAAATDIGQLQDAWSLQRQQLGSAWGQKRDQLGAQFGTAFSQGKQASTSAAGKSGLAFSGTTYGMQKGAERDAFRQYGLGVQAGQSAYEQAMATGQLGLRQATTDIYQGLESDIYGERDRWQREQRANLNTLLGMDIWDTGGPSGPNTVTPESQSGEDQWLSQTPWYQQGFSDEASYNAWVEAGSDPSQRGLYGHDPQNVVENLNETIGLSDIRLKKDINHLFTLDNGVPIYTFKYKWSDNLHIGTMAQDIEEFMPDAVGEMNGIKYVNYSHIWR